MPRTTALHPRFGVEVHDVDLRQVTPERHYPELRGLFERHSLLLFRGQELDDGQQLAFGALFGPIEVRSRARVKPKPFMPAYVSNRMDEGGLHDEHSNRMKILKASQLWHTDSTFLPIPALANVIMPRALPSRGGETELVSTRAAWRDMPEALRARARHAVLRHRLSHSRAKIDPAIASLKQVSQWEETAWRAVWPNPVTGEEALYVAAHACGVVGLPDEEGLALIDELIAFCTQDRYVYRHAWRMGDVIIWDERATMHRGRPWPYEEERSMATFCVSAQASDGLEAVRPAAA